MVSRLFAGLRSGKICFFKIKLLEPNHVNRIPSPIRSQPKAFNQRFRLAMVCPISGGAAPVARDTGFLVPLLGAGLKTDGCVHAHQIKSLDWAVRKASLIERAPPHIVSQVLGCLMSVLEE